MAAPVEREEKHKQLSLSFHRSLGISQTARDSHIPTAWHRPGWKSGKPKTGFPLSHAGLATTARVAVYSGPKYKKGIWPLRGLPLVGTDPEKSNQKGVPAAGRFAPSSRLILR